MKKKTERKKVISAVVIIITITFCAMAISTIMAKERLNRESLNKATANANTLSRVINMFFMSGTWTINSFISGIAKTDAVDSLQFNYVLDKKTLETITVEDIYGKLESFLTYNSDLMAAMFILKPGVLKNAPEGIAAAVEAGTKRRYDLRDFQDIYSSRIYTRIGESEGSRFFFGSRKETGSWVLTSGVKLVDENGTLIGEILMDSNIDIISSALEQYQSANDLVSFLINKHLTIVASSHPESNGLNLRDLLRDTMTDYPITWLEDLENVYDSGKDTVITSSFDGKECLSYVFPVKQTKFRLVIVKPKDKVLDRAKSFGRQLLAISAVSILLIVTCLLFIFKTYWKKAEENKKIENELELAFKIQQSILPPDMNIPGKLSVTGLQKPAKSVGGDLYDYVLKDGKLQFCIGDVSGKGVPAALLMCEICSLYRYLAKETDDVVEIVSKLNGAAMENDDERDICTLFAGSLDLETGVLEYCNAGHNPPMLTSGKETQYLKTRPDMPVYAYDGFKYHKEEIRLKPGDRLLLYTDGVTEARKGRNRFFGNEAALSMVRSMSSLSPVDLLAGIERKLALFRGNTEQNDDITILCIDYRYENQHK